MKTQCPKCGRKTGTSYRRNTLAETEKMICVDCGAVKYDKEVS